MEEGPAEAEQPPTNKTTAKPVTVIAPGRFCRLLLPIAAPPNTCGRKARGGSAGFACVMALPAPPHRGDNA
ncbi:hypothetical protein FRACA_10001 [Frankia canadensis]|uniref:Uncharacterized protein n=1 Tax=Frankia canadensis TaxID=1836972 RepID=A0A2I2KHV8_9ACTN|nr:hypothetical protein FRACA_10001 [Frankia canadensis]SOU52532.1 hypothetical protein FRACA_10001 [Frankia canadensis]